MRIAADTTRCIGAGMCAFTSPEIFDQNEQDGTVVLLRPEPSDAQADTVRRAIRNCPSGALSLAAPTKGTT
ncbi:ferredoxin [Nonomuraea sp. NPDC049141]|uniref:ferredoxin n=1 Tax=Nonomuraea sp. NPDC049141 TaxID=3155500 RepID=UPI0033C3AA19